MSSFAFQGERGAFSEEAGRLLLGPRARPLPCPTFDAVFRAVETGRAHVGVVPVENTLAGAVSEVCDLLLARTLRIHGEARLRVRHNLIALPGVRLGDVRRVYSHPVALAQCAEFFRKRPRVEPAPFYDTAGSVKMLFEKGLRDAAAIGPRAAAGVYGCRVLLSGLEDLQENFTRFLLLKKGESYPRGSDKISLVFSTRNVPGALFRCLAVFALRDLNLTRIESRPIRGRPWEYHFYADLLGSLRDGRVRRALDHLAEVTQSLTVLGSYPSA